MRRPGMPLRPSESTVAALLTALALAACWLVTALLYALLTQPADTLTTLHARGARGMPSVMWAGSRDLVRLVQPGTWSVTHD